MGSERGGQARGATLSGGRRRRVLVMLSRFPWRPALSELIGGRRGGVRCNPSRSPLRARAQSFHTTLSESQTYVHEAKKSRFVAVASPVSSAEEAMVRTSSPFSSRTNATDHLLPSPALTDLCCFPYDCDCSSTSWGTCRSSFGTSAIRKRLTTVLRTRQAPPRGAAMTGSLPVRLGFRYCRP